MSDEHLRYKELDPDQIGNTVTRLGKRIKERFPESGLASLCEELRIVATVAKERSLKFKQPIVALRIGSALLILMILLGIFGTGLSIKATKTHFSITEFIQLLEAGINDLVLIGAGLFFLLTLETRIKRSRALEALHELRSFAHIIDMHQLTKDMTRMEHTPSSPHRPMTPAQLLRYLDYCSEMLSLVGKIAALYVQHFNDSGAIATVTEVENLTTGLSRKIWQKITLIEKHMPISVYTKDDAANLAPEGETDEESVDDSVDATKTAPVAEKAQPKQAKPKASKDKAPEAKDKAPEAKDKAPEAKDKAPEAKDKAPEAKDKAPEAKDEDEDEDSFAPPDSVKSPAEESASDKGAERTKAAPEKE